MGLGLRFDIPPSAQAEYLRMGTDAGNPAYGEGTRP